MEKYAVITGASSGIGKEFAKLLSLNGYHLILVARRKEKLQELETELHTICDIFVADLSLEKDCLALYDFIKNMKIDIFINNAGFGDCCHFIDGNLEKEMNMIRVNVQAVHLLTKLILSHMYKEDYGFILNVASSAGLMPAGPYMSTYYATKAYVTSLTQGIAEELRKQHSHVYVGCLCPGPVDTEFNQIAEVEFSLKGISAKYCVHYAYQMMMKRKVVIVPSWKMKIAVIGGHFLPRQWLVRIAAHQQKKKMYR